MIGMKRAMLLCIALCLCTASALAAPSISELEQPRAVEINPASAADALWEALEGDTIYTSRALVEQYDGQLGSVIALAEETLEETCANGHTLAQRIPSVQQIFASNPREENDEAAIDLSRLKQLTYMQDFKRESTGWRIVQSDTLGQAIEVTISGSEVVKAGRKEDFVILQINPDTGKLICLPMKEYDPETGAFVVEFPSFGPYMIAQLM